MFGNLGWRLVRRLPVAAAIQHTTLHIHPFGTLGGDISYLRSFSKVRMEFLRGCHVTSASAAARNGTPHDDSACVADGLHLEDLDFGIVYPTRDEMERDVMDRLGIRNLSCPKESEIDRVVDVATGCMYGPANIWRIVPLVVKHGQTARWVFFMLNHDCRRTHLSLQTSKALGFTGTREMDIAIGGHKHRVTGFCSKSRFPDMDLLGRDFLVQNNLRAFLDYSSGIVKLYWD